MTLLLLDTNIVSELSRSRRDPSLAAWWEQVDAGQLYISVLTLGELQHGIERLRHRDADRAERIARWADELRAEFENHILPIDVATAQLWGELSTDRSRPVVDTLIAATAIVHGMMLVTRNLRDMRGLPVELVNPFTAMP